MAHGGGVHGGNDTVFRIDHFPAFIAEEQGPLASVKGDAEGEAFGGQMAGKASEFPYQEEVAVVIGCGLGVRNFFGIVEPEDSAIVGDVGGERVFYASHALDGHHGKVKSMDSHVANLGVAVIPEEPPFVVEPIRVEGAFWSRAEPGIVIDRGRWIGVWWIADRRTDLSDPAFDEADFAEFSGGDVFGGGVVELSASALETDLDDTVVLSGGVSDQLSLPNCLAEGFFNVDIFASLAGKQGDVGMPVVRGRYHNGIDVRVFEDGLEVAGLAWPSALPFFDHRADLVEDGLIDVANGLDYTSGGDGVSDNLFASVVAADQSQDNAFVGAEDRWGPCGQACRSKGHVTKECSSVLHGLGSFLVFSYRVLAGFHSLIFGVGGQRKTPESG